MRTKIKARKSAVIKWIVDKFGSLEMLANVAGVDTSLPQVKSFLRELRTSREPVILSIRFRSAVLEVSIEHHKTVNAAVIQDATDAVTKFVDSVGPIIPDVDVTEEPA